MHPLRDLTRMFWSASQLHRRGRSSPHIKATLWHVARNANGALRARAIRILKEIING